MSQSDPFPASEFDEWAATYDQDVSSQNTFPFDGYERALEGVVTSAAPRQGMSVLDIGTGTGGLAARFAQRGCDVWCTDFSAAMLEKARTKLPQAHFVLHDMRLPMPGELQRRFDRIVSAYVFHHLELEGKVRLCRVLVQEHLAAGGRLVVADISFASRAAQQAFAQSVGELWEQEPYWLADEALPVLRGAGLQVEHQPVSRCTALYSISAG